MKTLTKIIVLVFGFVGMLGCESNSPTKAVDPQVVVEFTESTEHVNWIEVNDRDPGGLPLLRWQYEIASIPSTPTLSFDYAGAETDSTAVWLWDSFLTYIPATGGNEVFSHYEINVDPSLLEIGTNYISFVSGFIHSQGEADGVLFRNVEIIGNIFSSQSSDVSWVEINDRDPVGLPLIRWNYSLTKIPSEPVLVFEYAGAETDSTGIWIWDTFLAHLPATGADQVFHHYEVELDRSLLSVGDNFIGFVSGYIHDQEEADGVLLRNVVLVDKKP